MAILLSRATNTYQAKQINYKILTIKTKIQNYELNHAAIIQDALYRS